MNTLSRLAKSPGFAFAAIALFALGIGANAAIVGVLRLLYLEPLPFPAGDRLVSLYQGEDQSGVHPVAPGNFFDWREEARSFERLSSYFVQPAVLSAGQGEPVRLEVAEVSRDFFDTLRAAPIDGRLDVGAAAAAGDIPRAVLSESLWRSRFGGVPLAGTRFEIDGRAVEVIGVAPASVAVPPAAALWLFAPRDAAGLSFPGAPDLRDMRGARYLGVVGRLRDGVSLAAARAEMETLAARGRAAYPDDNRGLTVDVEPLAREYAGEAGRALRLLGVASALVLLLACLNLAGLFLARSAERERDFAVRAALGASPGQLRRVALAETVWLSAAGAVCGLGVSWLLTRALLGSLPEVDLAGRGAGLDPGAVAIAGLLAAGAALLAGVVPAVRASRLAPRAALSRARSGVERGSVALRGLLVGGQVALALLLLLAAGLLTQTLFELSRQRTGVEPRGAWSARLTFPAQGGDLDRTAKRRAMSDALAAVAALPGIESAGGGTRLPFSGCGPSSGLRVEGLTIDPAERPDACWRAIEPGTFRTLGARLVTGRDFTAADGPAQGAGVAIVNRTLADWLVRRDGAAPAPALTEGNVTSAAGDGFASLLGRRIATGLDAGEGEFVTVVGVVEDLPQASPDAAIAPEIYRPWAQATRWGVDTFRVVARGPMPSERALHDAVARVSPRLALDELRPLEVAARAVVAKPRIVGRLLSAFAGISLLLAAIGVHGLVALQVAERRRELGVRLALGARPWDLLRRAMVWGAKPGVWGLVAGAVAGAAAWPLFERLLGGLGRSPSAGGPWAPAFAAAVALAVATLVACLGPALRAARTEPVDVLRGE